MRRLRVRETDTDRYCGAGMFVPWKEPRKGKSEWYRVSQALVSEARREFLFNHPFLP
jgi:hypothetical protein